MFTGIIETTGTLKKIERSTHSRRITIQVDALCHPLTLGGSIAVDGVCLTIIQVRGKTFVADVSRETLLRSTLREAQVGIMVNLEWPVSVGGALGGHFVLGHVDGCGTIRALRRQGNMIDLRIAVPSGLRQYFIDKGSVAIDGISLTVTAVHPDGFSTLIIPHTLKATNLSTKRVGSLVNLEVDMLAKYVEKLLSEKELVSA